VWIHTTVDRYVAVVWVKMCQHRSSLLNPKPVLANIKPRGCPREFITSRIISKWKKREKKTANIKHSTVVRIPITRIPKFQNYFLSGVFTHIMDVGAFLQVRVTWSANIVALRMIRACINSPHHFELSILDCTIKQMAWKLSCFHITCVMFVQC